MTDKELIAFHEKAVADCNDLLSALGTLWQECTDALRCPKRGTSALELRNVLVRLQVTASDSIRRAMAPPTLQHGGKK